MASTRQLKFSRMLQRELGDIFQKDRKGYFSGNLISVSHVEVSPDFAIAHVHLSMVLDRDKEKMLEVVNLHKADIKRALSKTIGRTVRKIPELIFHLDLGAEHAQKMEELFKNLNKPSKKD